MQIHVQMLNAVAELRNLQGGGLLPRFLLVLPGLARQWPNDCFAIT